MKKLIFIFVAFLMLVTLTGCGARQNTIRYNNGDETEDGMTDTAEATEEGDETTEAEDQITDTDALETETGIEEAEKTSATTTPGGKLAVTSFSGGLLKTNLSYNVVKGTLSSDTTKITINDYELQKYISGQTQWDFIASTRFSTLKSGLNTYVVKTYDAKGTMTDSLIFTIDYTAPAVPESLPGVGTNHWLIFIASLAMAASYSILRKFKWL